MLDRIRGKLAAHQMEQMDSRRATKLIVLTIWSLNSPYAAELVALAFGRSPGQWHREQFQRRRRTIPILFQTQISMGTRCCLRSPTAASRAGEIIAGAVRAAGRGVRRGSK